MIDGPYFVLTVLALLSCGLVAGVFYGFSSFVMKGLADLPPAQGIAAMQSVNAAAPRPAFMAVFVGAAGLCAIVAVVTFVLWPEEGTVQLLLGAVLYLAGSFGVTVAVHMPRNDALDALVPGAPENADLWRAYVEEWTRWNHVRAAAALAASACFLLGLTA